MGAPTAIVIKHDLLLTAHSLRGSKRSSYMASRSLTPAQGDRAAGVLLGLACDDALGAGYEFGPARIHGEEVAISALTHGDREAGEACASPCGARRSATRSCTAASTASTSPCPIYRQTRRRELAAAPTPSPRSPADCLAPLGRFSGPFRNGGASCTAGPAQAAVT